MALRLPRWPSERENIEISVAGERGVSFEDALREVIGLADVALALQPDPRPDPIGEENERAGKERYMAWIRHCRERGR